MAKSGALHASFHWKRDLLVFGVGGPPIGVVVFLTMLAGPAIVAGQGIPGLGLGAAIFFVFSPIYLPSAMMTGAVVAFFRRRFRPALLNAIAALAGGTISTLWTAGFLLLLGDSLGADALSPLGLFGAVGAITAVICSMIARETKSATTLAASAVTQSDG